MNPLLAQNTCNVTAPSSLFLQQEQGNYNMHLKSSAGPINVFVMNQDEGLSSLIPGVPQITGDQEEMDTSQTSPSNDATVNNATTGDSSEVTKRVEPEVSSSEGVVTRSRRRQAALVEAEVTIGATVEASSQPLQMREVAERTEVCVNEDLPMDTDKVLLPYTISYLLSNASLPPFHFQDTVEGNKEGGQSQLLAIGTEEWLQREEEEQQINTEGVYCLYTCAVHMLYMFCFAS